MSVWEHAGSERHGCPNGSGSVWLLGSSLSLGARPRADADARVFARRYFTAREDSGDPGRVWQPGRGGALVPTPTE